VLLFVSGRYSIAIGRECDKSSISLEEKGKSSILFVERAMKIFDDFILRIEKFIAILSN